jgi:hypothetical protein
MNNKVQNEHHVKQPGFIPFVIEGVFLGDDNFTLDFYETKLFKRGSVKLAGFMALKGSPFVVILDTREVPADVVPFDYMRTFLDKFHPDVRKAIYAEDARLIAEANRLREEKEELISRPGNRVHVLQRYGRSGFTPANGTVLSRDTSTAKVRLDYGLEVEVEFSQLTEPKKNPKIFTLRGELNCLYGRLEATYQKPFGVDDRAGTREAIQGMIDRKIAELETLEAQPV